MYKGQPLRLEQILPAGISPEMFYVIAASLPAFIVMVVVGSSMIPRNSMSKRVKALQQRQAELKGEVIARRRRKRNKAAMADVNRMRRVVDKFKLLQSKSVTDTQSILIEAGWRNKDAIIIYAFFSLVCPIIFGIMGAALSQMHIFSINALNYGLMVGGIYFGMKAPLIVVRRRRKKRYQQILYALSDTLDLMTICAEAGLSLSATLDRVSRELGLAYPEMAEELGITSVEMGFLPERNKALMNLSERVKIDEVRGITNVLIQTEKYGTPISQALKVLATEFREQRMLRAENKAARLGPMMTVPMIVFILPTLFIMIISPAVIRMLDV